MSVPQRLTRKLQQTLGTDAAEDLVNLLNGVELQRSDLRAFREGMRGDFEAIRADFAEFRGAMRDELARTRTQIVESQAQLAQRISETKSDLMKWSFMFWVGAVTAIAALAGVLR